MSPGFVKNIFSYVKVSYVEVSKRVFYCPVEEILVIVKAFSLVGSIRCLVLSY